MKKILLLVLASGFIVANAFAVSVPYTFSNGTTADASQVNANFTALANAITALEIKLASVTPPADLTGYNYCFITHHGGVGLRNDGESALNTVGNGSASISFSTSSSGTWADLSFIANEVDFYVDPGDPFNDVPAKLVADRVQVSSLDTYSVAYSMDGNILTVIPDGIGAITFFMSPDANTIVGKLSEVGNDNPSYPKYFSTAIIGVRADSCD